MSLFYRLKCTINDGLIALMTEASTGNLRQQIVQPSTWTRMRMSSSDSDVLASVNLIFGTKMLKTFEDAIADSGISGLSVEDKVDETVTRTFGITKDESTGVKTLSHTGAKLSRVGIAHEIDFDDGTSDVSLADANKVVVRGRRSVRCTEYILRRWMISERVLI